MMYMMSPIVEVKSEEHGFVLRDALNFVHYWSKDGEYSGFDILIEIENIV
jgi:hypothetical protein